MSVGLEVLITNSDCDCFEEEVSFVKLFVHIFAQFVKNSKNQIPVSCVFLERDVSTYGLDFAFESNFASVLSLRVEI